MAKYIIDVPNEMAEATARYWNETTDMTLVPYTEPDRKAIEDEVWEFVRICLIMDGSDFVDAFDSCSYIDLLKYSYRIAKERYKAWEKGKEKIHVGDEVEQITASGNPTGLKCVVTKIVDDEILKGITQTGEIVSCFSQIKKWWRKTGRHFNEAEELLRKMEGLDD